MRSEGRGRRCSPVRGAAFGRVSGAMPGVGVKRRLAEDDYDEPNEGFSQLSSTPVIRGRSSPATRLSMGIATVTLMKQPQ